MNTCLSHCVVCYVQFATDKETVQHKNFSSLCHSLWKVFCDYLTINSSKWIKISQFYVDGGNVPFCEQCRNIVAELFVTHNELKLKNIKGSSQHDMEELDRLITRISSIVVESFKIEISESSDCAPDDQDREIVQRIKDLRRTIHDRYNSQVDVESREPNCEDQYDRPIKCEPIEEEVLVNTFDDDHFNSCVGKMKTEADCVVKTEPNTMDDAVEDEEFSFKIEDDDDRHSDKTPLPPPPSHLVDHQYFCIDKKHKLNLECTNCFTKFSSWQTFYAHCRGCQEMYQSESDDDDYEEEEDSENVEMDNELSVDPLDLNDNSSECITGDIPESKTVNCVIGKSGFITMFRVKRKEKLVCRRKEQEDIPFPTERVKKEKKKHPDRERERRADMANSFVALRKLIPGINRNPKCSKLNILQQAVILIKCIEKFEKDLVGLKAGLNSKNKSFKRQVRKLKSS